MARVRLSREVVERVCVPVAGRQVIYWDADCPCLGLLVGPRRKTFVVKRGGKRVAIGRWPTYDVPLARKRAREVIVDIDSGSAPRAGVTLLEASEEHSRRLLARGGSPSSVESMRDTLERYVPSWLPRPLESITRVECRDRHSAITRDHGPYAANRTFRYVRAVWNSASKVRDLPQNPARAVEWNRERRRREPIPWAGLPAWRASLDEIGPVRRDYALFVLLTGLRSQDAATVRWPEVDFEKKTIFRPRPKGGEDRAFTAPLSAAAAEILERRKKENEILYPGCEWAFPTRSNKGEVVPLVSRRGGGRSPHRLRDTFATACREAGVGWFETKCLMNHALPNGDVTAGYVRVSLEHLRACVDRVAEFLTARMNLSRAS